MKTNTKSRWSQAETLASLSGISKSTIFKHLSSVDKELVSNLTQTDFTLCSPEDIEKFKKVVGVCERAHEPKPKIKVHEPEEMTAMNEIKIGFWFINKIGSPDRAIQVLEACRAGLNKLETK